MTDATRSDGPVHARIEGAVVMIGFGSIGRGTLPLLERHLDYDRDRFLVIDPSEAACAELATRGVHHRQVALTPENYREILSEVLTPGAGFLVNLSVDTSSLDLMRHCRELSVPYIDTVVEPWAGFYFDDVTGGRADELRAAPSRPRREGRAARRHDGGVLLRRQSRDGLLVREVGADAAGG